MIIRERYLAQLKSKRGNRMIKIITGIRRSGKSVLLFDQYQSFLRTIASENHIIAVRLDFEANRIYRESHQLLQYLKSFIQDDKPYYILLDEIQLVDHFADILNELNALPNIDLYVTGSNSKMLSSDIETQFRGRGDVLRVFPLSFSEFHGWAKGTPQADFNTYLYFGGMPNLVTLQGPSNQAKYLKDLYLSVYRNDIIERYQLRKTDVLDRMFDLLCSSVGSLTSSTSIEKALRGKYDTPITDDTIQQYLDYFRDAFLFEKINRYDVRGKAYLKTLHKYFCVDVGLRNAWGNFREMEIPHLIENIVCIELLSRGYNVDIGVNGQKEIDFVATLGPRSVYIQIAAQFPDQAKIDSELLSFTGLGPSSERVVLTLDENPFLAFGNSAKKINLIDFLLDETLL